jgi:hypothetical protein
VHELPWFTPQKIPAATLRYHMEITIKIVDGSKASKVTKRVTAKGNGVSDTLAHALHALGETKLAAMLSVESVPLLHFVDRKPTPPDPATTVPPKPTPPDPGTL